MKLNSLQNYPFAVWNVKMVLIIANVVKKNKKIGEKVNNITDNSFLNDINLKSGHSFTLLDVLERCSDVDVNKDEEFSRKQEFVLFFK